MKKKLALFGTNCATNRKYLEARLSDHWETSLWLPGAPIEEGIELARAADATIVASDVLISGDVFTLLPEAKNLALYQIPFAGYDWLQPHMLPEGTQVCNAPGHEITIAEYILGGILESALALHKIDADFRAGSWKYSGTNTHPASLHNEVYGKKLGLIGYGMIGVETARRARAFGMQVSACARSKRAQTPENLEWIGTADDIPKLLAESDYIALVCDLNPDTYHLIDAASFKTMKSDAILINVARGPVVEEQALYQALASQAIGGAVLDVWYTYPNRPKAGQQPEANPRPSEYAFHDLPNVLMTPHCSAHTAEADLRRWDIMADNMNKLALGEKPSTVVMTGTGPQNPDV
ncbi:MAG: 2-hydroxyacid dehydrogenase [Parvibaculaceae bacterium]|nr:2-hydroxyacid dehydrogenase [Parvibaculaceae bacterium]